MLPRDVLLIPQDVALLVLLPFYDVFVRRYLLERAVLMYCRKYIRLHPYVPEVMRLPQVLGPLGRLNLFFFVAVFSVMVLQVEISLLLVEEMIPGADIAVQKNERHAQLLHRA